MNVSVYYLRTVSRAHPKKELLVGRERGKEKYKKKFPRFYENHLPTIQEDQQTPNTKNIDKVTWRHMITSFFKARDSRKTCVSREKGHIMYRRANAGIKTK